MIKSVLSFLLSFVIAVYVRKYMSYFEENGTGHIGKLLVYIILYSIAFIIVFFTLCLIEIIPYETIKAIQTLEKKL